MEVSCSWFLICGAKNAINLKKWLFFVGSLGNKCLFAFFPTGNKPYKCNQCSYACRQAYSLTQHMSQHGTDQPRADKPHVCLICRKTYSTIAMLISHTAMSHKTKLIG